MRWREIINEDGGSGDAGGDSGSSSGSNGNSSNGGKSGGRKKFHPHHQNAIPDVMNYPDLPAHYYNMYRFGVHMAGSPLDQEYAQNGPASNEMLTLAYSSADLDIIQKSAKEMGLKGSAMTKHGSTEPDDTYVKSPVNNWNPRS